MDYLKKASNPKIVSIVGIVTGVCVAVIYFIIRNIGLGGTAALLRGNTSGMGFIKPLYYTIWPLSAVLSDVLLVYIAL